MGGVAPGGKIKIKINQKSTPVKFVLLYIIIIH
jgi:hypothetical protein